MRKNSLIDSGKKCFNELRKNGILSLLRSIRHLIFRQYLFESQCQLRYLISKIKYDVPIRPLRIYWVNPDQISHTGPNFPREQIGTIKGGDWDKNKYKFTDSKKYHGLYQRFVENQEWEDTEYYQVAKNEIEQTGSKWGHTNIDSFIKHRGEYLDKIYNNIKNDGYKTQKEIVEDMRDKKRQKEVTPFYIKTHEIGCNIGRNGDLMINTGYHRLTIAKLLNIEEIPIQIIIRHKQWQELRDEIYQSGFNGKQRELRNHPDLRNSLI